ncbi:MAG: HEPN domain-containing protein [Magnetococcales bacterium]|nr:HEPN domain-containing protein [Magnetococcales bacterium]
MNGIDHARMLLKLARVDHRAMTGMVDREVFPDSIFGFHAQQAVEKGLKAWLAGLGVTFPLTHDINRLLSLLSKQGVEMTELWQWSDLYPFAVELRYTWLESPDPPLERMELIERISVLLRRIEEIVDALAEQAP